MLQKFSLLSKHFKESTQIANDVQNFFRSFVVNSDDNFQMLTEMLSNYDTFTNHLIETVKNYNTAQNCNIRLYNYTGKDLFLSILHEHFKSKSKDDDTDVKTIDIIVNL